MRAATCSSLIEPDVAFVKRGAEFVVVMTQFNHWTNGNDRGLRDLSALRFCPHMRDLHLAPTELADLQGLRPSQLAWLSERNDELNVRARELRLGRSQVLGRVPLDPVLQWNEQLLTDSDLYGRDVANAVTVAAFADLAERLLDDSAWARR